MSDELTDAILYELEKVHRDFGEASWKVLMPYVPALLKSARAGQHSRDEEIARLMARVAELEQEATELEGMLADKALESARIASELTDQLEAAEKRAAELQAELEESMALAAKNGLNALDMLRERDEPRAELAATKELREGDLTALSKSCNELSAALADRSELIEKMRKARRQRNEAVADAAVLRHKLAEVERELATVCANIPVKGRETFATAVSRIVEERDRLRAELASCRKVVEAVISWRKEHRDWCNSGPGASLAPYCRAESEMFRALDALASAGKDSGEGQTLGKDGAGSAGAAVGNEAGTEGARPSGLLHSAQPAPSEPAKCAHYQHKWLYRRDLGKNQCMGCRELMPEPAESAKSLRAQAREKLDALSDSQVSNLWLSLERLEPEPPSNHPGIPESSDAPLPFPWRLEFDGLLWSIMSADDQHVADDLLGPDARHILARCNAPEPAATVPLAADLDELDRTFAEARRDVAAVARELLTIESAVPEGNAQYVSLPVSLVREIGSAVRALAGSVDLSAVASRDSLDPDDAALLARIRRGAEHLASATVPRGEVEALLRELVEANSAGDCDRFARALGAAVEWLAKAEEGGK